MAVVPTNGLTKNTDLSTDAVNEIGLVRKIDFDLLAALTLVDHYREVGTMEIRRVQAGEGEQFRELRLRALADAPHAFVTTLTDAQKMPMEYWEERASRHAAGEGSVMFVATEDEHWCGLAGGYFLPDVPGTVELISMWVDPEWRLSGLGRSLVASVAGWARERGASQIRLWVGKGNFAARTLYRRAGFADTGEAKPLPSNGAIEQIMMRRDL